jgi:3-oxoacyl-[acyl-carrier-protein] synthase II
MTSYIRATGNISPQLSFGNNLFPTAPIAYEGNRMTAIEPDYRALIDAKLIRRMSRIIKMGVAAAQSCLQEAGTVAPDAILTGTAYGCLEDTEAFLAKMVENKEALLTPTAFIQSTHNTVGSQIALLLQCHGYNNTFVHKGFSFETALLDAMLLLAENDSGEVLVGGLDEITDSSHAILSRFGLYKRKPGSSLALFDSESKGTIAGEGAAFFLLSNKPSSTDYARIQGVSTLYKPLDVPEVKQHLLDFLHSCRLDPGDIDLLITGRNGDQQGDEIYQQVCQAIFSTCTMIPFKQLCGEYPTATAFALWLAAVILKNGGPILADQETGKMKTIMPRQVLIYNQYQGTHHSFFLISHVDL